MKKFEEYITDENIIFYLCRMRAKLAKQRNKKHLIHYLTSNSKYNYHRKLLSQTEIQLQELLPTRRKWVKLGENSRRKNGQGLNSVRKNIRSLQKTIMKYRKFKPHEPFVQKLNSFIEEIKISIKNNKYNINKPDIYPKPKEDNKTCRPISIFPLKEKIIICLTNKYFTDLFDDFFFEHSYAFRSTQLINGKKKILSHHDAIKTLMGYQQGMGDKKLWVSECDMKKFYDTVNHSIIKKSFNKLISRVKKEKPDLYSKDAERLFYQYLESYKFNKNVLPYNKHSAYFKKFNIPNGKFGWVKKEFEERNYYKSFNNAKIGVPQGGALSSLIANIVLDYADKQVLNNSDDDLLYLRYCDDMIIIHPDKEKCEEASKTYKDSLESLKLIPHEFKKDLQNTADSFWAAKSKAAYKWDGAGNGVFPWIGFVGYEIHHKGYIRVRKSSLKKEMKKQYETINEIKLAVPKEDKRVTNKAILESAINRLIGMSVGRVKIWNFKIIKNDMCWINGFSELTDNKYSRIQLKRLDKNRNRLICKLVKKLKDEGEGDNIKPKEERKDSQIVYYGKPFSYYYQARKNMMMNKQ